MFIHILNLIINILGVIILQFIIILIMLTTDAVDNFGRGYGGLAETVSMYWLRNKNILQYLLLYYLQGAKQRSDKRRTDKGG